MGKYSKTTWYNNVTKVNATNMNHIEEGIYENANDIEQIQHDMENYENEISEVQEDVEQCEEDILELKNKIEIFKELTYAELKVLKNNNELVPNKAYRITDYVTKTNGTVNGNTGIARSVKHPFDIIVTAIDTNKFDEVARAVNHSGDTYFANSNLSAWKLWYCLDNDTDRFEWADTSIGKGVIYRMIDEFGNDLPYDFKNIQFKRYKITATTNSRQSSLVGLYLGVEGCYGCTYDSSDYVWRYTFDKRADNTDLSLTATYQPTIANSYYVKEVVIGTYLTDNGAYRCKQALNDIVITSSNIIIDVKMGTDSCFNTWNGNSDITYNYFGQMCRRNILSGEIVHVNTRECFQENIIGTSTLSDNAFRWMNCQNHFQKNIVIRAESSFIETSTCSENVFPGVFKGNIVSGGRFSNNNFGNLSTLQNCKLGLLQYCTFIGSLFETLAITYLFDCDINIFNFLGSKINREEYVEIVQGSTNLNVINLTIDSLIGTENNHIVITLSDLINAGNPCSKHLGYAKSNYQNRVLSYTWEEVDDSAGVNFIVRNNSGKMISADYGSTWIEISSTDVNEIHYADVEETQDADDKLRITNARLNNAIKNQELLTVNEAVFEDFSQYNLLYYALSGASDIIFYPVKNHSSSIKYVAFGGNYNTRITLTFSLYRDDEEYLIDEFTVEPLQRSYLVSTTNVSYDDDAGYLYIADILLEHLIKYGNIDLQFNDEIFDGIQDYDNIYDIMYSSSVYKLETADPVGGVFSYLYNDGTQLYPMSLFVDNDNGRLYIDFDVSFTDLRPTTKIQHNINGHFSKLGTDYYYNLTLPGDSNDDRFTSFDDVVKKLITIAQDVEYPCTGYIPIETPTTNGTVTTYGMISSIKAYMQSNNRKVKFTWYYADTNGLQKRTDTTNTTGTTDDITDTIYVY